MPEILTESFCERCGTRYTFESAAPTKIKKLGRFKTLSKGLKNYVLSDESSMDEAMAAARSDEERAVTSLQLDAFHSTFNFCMTCRQYTCGNCWNQAEGTCLTCSPHLGHEIMPAPFPDLTPIVPAESLRFEASAWPVSDLVQEELAAEPTTQVEATDEVEDIDVLDRLARISGQPIEADVVAEAAWAAAESEGATESDALAASAWPIEAEQAAVADEVVEVEPTEPDAVAAGSVDVEAEAVAVEEIDLVAAEAEALPADQVVEPVAQVGVEPEAVDLDSATAASIEDVPVPVEVAAVESETEELPADMDGRAAAAAQRTADLLTRFRPGQSIDAELEAYEASIADDSEPVAVAAAPEPEPEPEPMVAAAPEPEPELVVAAAPEPEPELVVEAPEVVEEVAAEAEVDAEPAIAAEAEIEPEVEAEPAIAAEAEIEPEVEAEPAIAAEAEIEPEVAAEAPAAAAAVEPAWPVEPEPPSQPEPEPARADVVEQPTWRIVAPDLPAPVTNGHPAAEPTQPAVAASAATPPPPAAEPSWPTAPQWPAAQPDPSVLASRRTAASAATDALWAASARDVVATPSGAPAGGVQSCSSCGLSLSATARFCRRCGSRQGA